MRNAMGTRISGMRMLLSAFMLACYVCGASAGWSNFLAAVIGTSISRISVPGAFEAAMKNTFAKDVDSDALKALEHYDRWGEIVSKHHIACMHPGTWFAYMGIVHAL